MVAERHVSVIETQSKTTGFQQSAQEAKALDAAFDSVTESSKRVTQAQISAEAAFNRLNLKYDEAARSAAELARVQATVARAESQGVGTAAERANLLAAATARHEANLRKATGAVNDNARAMGLASHQVQNLAYQFNDLAVQIGSGQGLFRPFLQQGAQIVQILGQTEGGIGAGLKGMGSLFAAAGRAAVSGMGLAVGAIGGVTAAIIAATAAVNDYREQYNEMLRVTTSGAGRMSGLRPDDIQEATRAAVAASKGGISPQDARAVATELAKTGKIGADVLTGLTGLSEKFAKTLGVDTATAAKQLAAAFAQPGQGAEQLARQLQFLSGKQIEEIQHLARINDLTGAQAALFKALASGPLIDTANQVDTLAKAWERFKNFALADADRVVEALGKIGMPKTPEQQIKDIQNLPGTGLGGRVTEEDQQRRSAAILKIQADASAKELALQRATEEAKRAEISRTGDAVTASVNSTIGKFKELETQSAQLTAALKHPELLADAQMTAQALETVKSQLGGATTAAQYYAVTLERIAQQGALNVQSMQLQTQAQIAKTEAERQYVALLQADLAAEQAKQAAIASGATPEMARLQAQNAYNASLQQYASQQQIISANASERIQQGQQEAQMTALQNDLQNANNLAERDAIVQKIANLTYEKALNAELQKGVPYQQAKTLALQAYNAVLDQEAAARERAEKAARKQLQAGELQIQNILASTVAERAKIAAEQSMLETQGSLLSSTTRLAMAEQARNQVLAQATAQLRQMVSAQEGELTVLDAKISSINMERGARAALIAGIEAENQLKQMGMDLNSNEAQTYIDNAQAIAEMNVELEKAEERKRNIAQAIAEEERALRSSTDAWRSHTKAINDYGTTQHTVEMNQAIKSGGVGSFTASPFESGPYQAYALQMLSLNEALGNTTFSKALEEYKSATGVSPGSGTLSTAMMDKTSESLDTLSDAGKDAASSLEDIGKPIQDEIDTLRDLQEKALTRAYKPDPYAERNPEFFYNGEKIFREGQDKVFNGLQSQIAKLQELQGSLLTLVSQGNSLPQTLVNALISAGFGNIAQQIINAMQSAAPPPSATPAPTAVQGPSLATPKVWDSWQVGMKTI